MKDPRRDRNLLAWEGSKIKTLLHLLADAWGTVLVFGVPEPEQKGKHGHTSAPAASVHRRRSAGSGFEVVKSLQAGDVNGGPSPVCVGSGIRAAMR